MKCETDAGKTECVKGTTDCGSENETGIGRFKSMIQNCLTYAKEAKAAGKPIVGIMCEYTPRELIMAAGAVPVCLCGGSMSTIPAAESDLPAGLCPLIKSTYGYHIQRNNPFLEMADLLVAETTCDGKKKMYELLSQERPMYVLELPQKPNDSDAMRLWTRELDKFKAELEGRFQTTVTPERLRAAVEVMNRERQLRRQLAQLMARPQPPFTGRELLSLKSSISGICADLRAYEEIIQSAPRAACDRPRNHRVRALLTGVPTPHGAERVVDLIEAHGGLVVCMENCTGIKPLLEDVDPRRPDLLSALAEHYFHLPCSVMTPNDGRLESIKTLAEEYQAQCVVDLVWQGCLTYDVEATRVRQFCESTLNLPYLKIVTDYSPADSARLAVRLEALFETLPTPSAA